MSYADDLELYAVDFILCKIMYALPEPSSNHLRYQLEEAIGWCDRLFGAIKPQALYERPISLRHPAIFYYGHLPAFAWNQIFRGVLKRRSFNEPFDVLFERGIDPPEDSVGQTDSRFDWPSIGEIERYKGNVEDELFKLYFEGEAINEALHIVLEHYWMHAETLIYLIHQLPHEMKNPIAYERKTAAVVNDYTARVTVPAGYATLGAKRDETEFSWCNEYDEHRVYIPGFSIDKYKVTNGAYLEFVENGGYERERLWDDQGWKWIQSTGRAHPHFWFKRDGNWFLRDLFEDISLPLDWPVYVSHAEAAAYARFKGAELPSEEEFHRAAYGSGTGSERPQPWGFNLPMEGKGNFGFRSLSPAPVGAYPHGTSEYGVADLIGNGWEWTRTIFAPFAGFKALPTYPGYSADFFDSRHYVLKGASPVTADKLVRRSFRNWFRPNYPYTYSSFRCVYR
jgi:ergothioneine biosynthesis protein EgtB